METSIDPRGMEPRGLGSGPIRLNTFSPHQVFIQQVLAVCCASISIIAAFFSFYWFFRMRTSFRH